MPISHTESGKVEGRAGLNVCGGVCLHWVMQHHVECSGKKMEQHFFLKLCVLLQNSYLGNKAICRHLSGSVKPFSPFFVVVPWIRCPGNQWKEIPGGFQ